MQRLEEARDVRGAARIQQRSDRVARRHARLRGRHPLREGAIEVALGGQVVAEAAAQRGELLRRRALCGEKREGRRVEGALRERVHLGGGVALAQAEGGAAGEQHGDGGGARGRGARGRGAWRRGSPGKGKGVRHVRQRRGVRHHARAQVVQRQLAAGVRRGSSSRGGVRSVARAAPDATAAAAAAAAGARRQHQQHAARHSQLPLIARHGQAGAAALRPIEIERLGAP